MKVRNEEEEKKTTTTLQQQQQERSSSVQRGEREERKKKQQMIPLQRLQNTATPRRGRREQEEEEGRNGGGGGGEGKTVVVGIRMDSQSRELLTWALVKVAGPGDLVIALHVLPSTTTRESPDVDVMSTSSLLSLVKAFDSVLSVYDGFCNLKQIELKMKICRGSSIRKVLVHEARSYGAASLILGVNKNVRTIGSSCTSVAKYCAKKLSPECAVLAVNNGKVVFQREAPSPAPRSTSQFSAVNEKADGATLINSHPCQSTKKSNTSNSSPRRSATVMRRNPGCHTAGTGVTEGRGRSVSCFAMSRDKEPPVYGEHMKKESLAIVPVKKREAPLSSLSALFRDVSEARPGWPFLRRDVLSDKGANHLEEKSRMSVVQWAMRLPSRYTASAAAQGGCKTIKRASKVRSEPDEENTGVVPVVPDWTSAPSGDIKEKGKVLEELKLLEEKYASVCRLFRYEELMHITSNFSPENLVGKGGSSKVFKGHLEDGKKLAVKILKPSEDDAMKEFVSEIEIITALHHKNIVSLIGFCFENDYLILVYDFLPRGSLEDNLHGENDSSLSWGDRYKVALGVAQALDYLHGTGNTRPVIHRDVKSSNILLNYDFEPQLSDFGLAMWASASVSQLTCNDVAGTFGYLAPEYFMYGKINEKTDVYAFGVVLLELVSGRKPVSTGCPKGEESLVMWAMSILQGGKVKQLVDPCLGTDYDEDQLQRMILAASLCIKRSPRSRPCMQLVLKLLQGDGEVLRWATTQVGAQEGADDMDEEATLSRSSNIQSHINLALLDTDDDSVSVSSTEPVDFLTANKSLEEYLQGRWSRSSSFD